MALILIGALFLLGGFNMELFSDYQRYVWLALVAFPLFLLWFVSSLAETNRTPFDFAEGESELVSGFNTEYSRGGFALIFIAEYSRILFIRALTSIFFLGGYLRSPLFYLKLTGIAFCFV